jgi:hypothetical protein
MSENGQSSGGVDLIRWTFAVRADRRQVIAEYLSDLGFEVLTKADNELVVLIDEPDAEVDIDAIVGEVWTLNGDGCDITHEEFHRLNLMAYEPDEATQAAE